MKRHTRELPMRIYINSKKEGSDNMTGLTTKKQGLINGGTLEEKWKTR